MIPEAILGYLAVETVRTWINVHRDIKRVNERNERLHKIIRESHTWDQMIELFDEEERWLNEHPAEKKYLETEIKAPLIARVLHSFLCKTD